MKKVRNEEHWVATLRSEYFEARSRSAKEGAQLIDRYAELHDMDRSSIFRKINAKICKRRATDEEIRSMREVDAYAMDVWNFQRSKSRDGAEFHTTNAFNILVAQGKIPAHITLDAVYHSMQRQCLKNKNQAVKARFERQTPLSLLQVDYTVSRYFKNAGEGRVILVDGRKNTYKYTKEEDRVWYAQAIDDASRVIYGEYVFTKGESMEMVHGFLVRAMAQKERVIEETGECITDRMFQGMPKCIYWDRSSTHESPVTEKWLEGLGIEIAHGGEERDSEGKRTGRSNKAAHGKAERNIRDLKEGFEQLMHGNFGEGRKWSLWELNELHWEWLRKKNSGLHPTREGSRWDIFEAELANARYPDDTTLAITQGAFKRKVKNRLINVGRHLYAIAPLFCNDGDEVLIIPERGNFYLLHDGARHLLQLQNQNMKQTARAELSTDVLSDIHLRERFNAELKKISEGELSISVIRDREDLADDLEFFFEREQTIEAIKNFARQIAGAMQSKPANIIMARI